MYASTTVLVAKYLIQHIYIKILLKIGMGNNMTKFHVSNGRKNAYTLLSRISVNGRGILKNGRMWLAFALRYTHHDGPC